MDKINVEPNKCEVAETRDILITYYPKGMSAAFKDGASKRTSELFYIHIDPEDMNVEIRRDTWESRITFSFQRLCQMAANEYDEVKAK